MMKDLKILFSFVLLCLAATVVCAQSWDMFLDKGREHYNKGNYEKAIENLELYLKYETANPKAEAKQLLENAKKRLAEEELNFIETTLGLNMKMIYVEGGTFMMGAPEDDEEAWPDECPQHQVTLSSYYIAEYEVTQSQWQKIMGTTIYQQRDKTIWTDLHGVGSNYPMYYVNHDEAKAFCEKLTNLTGKTYKLPTDAQWEFAARGGNKSRGYKYSGSNSIDAIAWYENNSSSTSHPVGQKQPNELGLYDMTGNVMEWCSDWNDSYSSSHQINPEGPSSGQYRVLRNGGWEFPAESCRVSFRFASEPSNRDRLSGFRVVCIPD